MKRRQKKGFKYSEKALIKDITRAAKELEYSEDWTQTLIEKTVGAVNKYLDTHVIVEDIDLKKIIDKKLADLDKDLAFVIKNHDKII